LTKLGPLGLAGSGPIPDGAMLPTDPIGAIASGNYLHVPVLASNTRDEGKLFPTYLALFGGPSGRLVTDQQLFDIQYAYQPNAAPQITIDQWIPLAYLPVTTPVTGFDAKTELLKPALSRRGLDERAEHAQVAAERRLVLPLRLGPGAGAVQRHLRRGARV